MAKLPPDFVKAPVFDSPLRATITRVEVDDRRKEIVLRVDEAIFAALEAESAREGLTTGELAKRILKAWVEERERPVASAAKTVPSGDASHLPPAASASTEAGRTTEGAASSLARGLVAQVLERVKDQMKRFRLIDASFTWAVEKVRSSART